MDVIKEIQITNDGVIDTVFNGIPDYSYEESILCVNYAYYINPSGSTIAFAQINDTLVKSLQYPMYGHPQKAGQYPVYK